jgi:cholesterol transport system auxiliary component
MNYSMTHSDAPLATRLCRRLLLPLFGSALLLAVAGCGSLSAPARPVVYDFGPGATALMPSNRMARLPTITLPEVDAPAALEGTAVLYRLAYADAQQLRPYAQARWTMAAAQLLRQRLREQLGQTRTVLAPGEAGPVLPVTSTQPFVLQPAIVRIELEEFSQLFDAPQTSSGLVRVRATVLQTGHTGARTYAQQTFVVRRPAATADAAGGVKALAQATEDVITQLEGWLQQTIGTP